MREVKIPFVSYENFQRDSSRHTPTWKKLNIGRNFSCLLSLALHHTRVIGAHRNFSLFRYHPFNRHLSHLNIQFSFSSWLEKISTLNLCQYTLVSESNWREREKSIRKIKFGIYSPRFENEILCGKIMCKISCKIFYSHICGVMLL